MFLAVLAGLSWAGAAAAAPAPDPTRAAASAMLPEFVEFLSLPNVTRRTTAEIRKNADWAEAAFKRHGWTAKQLEDGETPMVFAEWPGSSPARKTILFYAHMDGQAVKDSEWQQPSPFTPTLKAKQPDGSWKAIPLEGLYGPSPDPEWRLFARSASDDKGPIVMLIAAMDAMKAAKKTPAINIKVILDSHEEGGPPTLVDVVKRNAELLKADAILMMDGPMHESNKPTVVFGHRSGAGFTLTVYGARTELHSGHYGNYAPNPVYGLAEILNSFKDKDGRVVIPGFYDGVDLSKIAPVLAAVPDDEPALRKRLGIARNDKVGKNYQEALNYPSLNITAMGAADLNARRSIIPATAVAAVEIRTVPATPGARQVALVRKWIEGLGYHVLDRDPTDEERDRYPKLAKMEGGGGGGKPLYTPLDAPVGDWAYRALRGAFGEDPVRIAMMGGTVPTAPLIEGLNAPVLLVPLVNSDNNQHAANENLRLANYFQGVKTYYALFGQPMR
jgi:acetylornithine deacetylase/succinyl-diaminopimelate desuccinylase-like protein